MNWLRRLYLRKPLLAKWLFGVDPDFLNKDFLRLEVLRLRLFMWLWILVSLFVLLGVWQLRGELASCMGGLPLSACLDALSICQSGQPLGLVNISLGGV